MEVLYFIWGTFLFLGLPVSTLVLYFVASSALKRFVPNFPLWLRKSIVSLHSSISMLLLVASLAISGEVFRVVLKVFGIH
jgi:hypothetical protein